MSLVEKLERAQRKKAAPASERASEKLRSVVEKVQSAEAGKEGQAGSEESSSAGVELWLYGLGLGLVGFGAAYWIRRRKDEVLQSGVTGLRILDSTWVGKGQKLLLVGVGDEQVLVGASTAGLQQIAVLGERSGLGRPPASREASVYREDHDTVETLRGGTAVVERALRAPDARPSGGRLRAYGEQALPTDEDTAFSGMVSEELRRQSSVPVARSSRRDESTSRDSPGPVYSLSGEHKVRKALEKLNLL